ncbi:MAG TPA: sigma-70 family RNA polymerase sigma factor [Chthonomonadales bacterium]|nr:sigma-70 family RNA polymerase sigma factor [Chthonomonadales bacterium]
MSVESRRLSEAEVQKLLQAYRASGDAAVRDRIVMQFTNLVESVARRFAGAAEPVEDLVQEGFIGLIAAVDGYDASKGVKFSTYATHFVIGQIKHCLRDRGKIIKEPAWLQELNQRVTRTIERLSQELGRNPTHGEIGAAVGLSEEAIADLLTTREVFKVGSLDGGSGSSTDQAGAYDVDRAMPARVVECEVAIEERVVLEGALMKLKNLEQSVVYAYYYRGRNQTEIARELGISCNYVSHILRNATRKMRKILVSDELKEAQTELAHARRRLAEQAQILEEASVVDSLTRLYNGKYFGTRLAEELCRAGRHQYPVAVLLVELSGYDQFARSVGTLRAEETLRRTAESVCATVRRSDIVTRYRSETFALILPYTDRNVTVVADRVCRAVAEWLAENGCCAGRAPVGLRYGHAHFPEQATSAQALADRAAASMEPFAVPDAIAAAA